MWMAAGQLFVWNAALCMHENQARWGHGGEGGRGGGWVGGQACGTAAVKKAVLNIHSVPDV